jgi:hypothetical protein
MFFGDTTACPLSKYYTFIHYSQWRVIDGATAGGRG